jgi:hypothetical protein
MNDRLDAGEPLRYVGGRSLDGKSPTLIPFLDAVPADDAPPAATEDL